MAGKELKKLYISCPVRGRKAKDIRASREQMHRLAEAYVGDALEVIQFDLNEKAPVDDAERIWLLGRQIQKMADADYYIGIDILGVEKHINMVSDKITGLIIGEASKEDISKVVDESARIISTNRLIRKSGCAVENLVAKNYGIKSFYVSVSSVAPDILRVEG